MLLSNFPSKSRQQTSEFLSVTQMQLNEAKVFCRIRTTQKKFVVAAKCSYRTSFYNARCLLPDVFPEDGCSNENIA